MSAKLNAELDRLDDAGLNEDEDALYDAFTSWAEASGRPLYPHQEEALLELLSGNHVIGQTPTGSGKSMIALAGHFISLARSGRSYYTAPLKALVSEKFFDLVEVFGAENVGMVTGDISLNADAPIICCTAEILANQALREGDDLDADLVVMDEFHFYGDPQRGWAWRIPLLELSRPQFVLLSATLGDTEDLQEELAERTGRATSLLHNAKRPVPLEFDYVFDELTPVVQRLIQEGDSPVYIVHFTQNDAVNTAENLAKTLQIGKEQKREIRDVLAGQELGRGFGKTLRELLLQGIGVHHAGMIPRYRRLVERLAGLGLLQVISGTDTLGVGINVPIRTVLFTSLVKFDGNRSRHLSAREFHQIAGRAGRPGFDPVGNVLAISSQDELEKMKHQARLTAAQEEADEKKQKKLARKRPGAPKKGQQKGEVTWTKDTFERLRTSSAEQLHPRFHTSHALVLNVLQRPGDPEGHLLRLAEQGPSGSVSFTEDTNPHLRNLGDIYRSLVQAGLVERVPLAEPAVDGRTTTIAATGELPDDFALNQPLAPFALAVLDLLDPDSPTFLVDAVSVIESVMEDPRPLLFAQQRMARDQAFQTLRDEGVDFETRRDLVEEISWPTPLAETIFPAFEVFSETNPWVKHRQPSPKSVLREMLEEGLNFSGLVARYKLVNAEGVVLRYLSDVYRALRQVLPEHLHTDEVVALLAWLRQLLASVDSSLVDEWEAMLSPNEDDAPSSDLDTASEIDAANETAFGQRADGTIDFGVNTAALRAAVRREVFRLVELAAYDRFETLAERSLATKDESYWENALGRYWAEHEWIRIDQAARDPLLLNFNENPDAQDLADASLPEGANRWALVTQTILDPDETGEWRLTTAVDLTATKETGKPVVYALSLEPYS